MKKPREWWIYSKHAQTWVEYQRLHIADEWSVEWHVIEMSAYDSLKSEYDNLCKFATDYEQQRDSLQGKLDIAVKEIECLRSVLSEYGADHTGFVQWIRAAELNAAREALAKINALKPHPESSHHLPE